MRRTFPPLVVGWILLCPLCASVEGQAQAWEFVRTLQVGDFPEDAYVELALDGDVLAVSISTEEGGATRIFSRNQDGLDQWGVLGSLTRNDPMFGRSLAMRNGILAIGSPGASHSVPFSGEVLMYRIDPNELTGPVQEIGTIRLPDATGNDLFGSDLEWSGDTLLASAVGRFSYHVTGLVALCAAGPGGFAPIGILPMQSTDVQLPFTRWFGGAIAVSEGSIAVASPFSGFDGNNAGQNIGSVHLYKRDPNNTGGWMLDTVWFDPALDLDQTCVFERIELGRNGLAFVGNELVMDHSRSYTGVAGSPLVPWQGHDPAMVGCEECGSRIVGHGATWGFGTSVTPGQDSVQYQPGVNGWSVADGDVFIEWYRPADGTWRTWVHRKDIGGPDAWGVLAVIEERDECDDLRGPLAIGGGHLVRSSVVRGASCGVEPGLVHLELQIFRQ